MLRPSFYTVNGCLLSARSNKEAPSHNTKLMEEDELFPSVVGGADNMSSVVFSSCCGVLLPPSGPRKQPNQDQYSYINM